MPKRIIKRANGNVVIVDIATGRLLVKLKSDYIVKPEGNTRIVIGELPNSQVYYVYPGEVTETQLEPALPVAVPDPSDMQALALFLEANFFFLATNIGNNWGGIGGTLSDQTDLQTALDAKLDDSQLDTDSTMAANSDTKIATQKATKTALDAKLDDSQLSIDATFVAASNTTVPSTLATKTFVETFLAGQHFHEACRLGTTANLTATYNNGTLGVGATLTNSGALVALSIDSVAVALNDRILVKDQTAQAQNGIYIVTAIGSGVAAWVLTRTIDFDTAAEIGGGDTVNVLTGTINNLKQYIQTTPNVVVGTSNIVWAQSAAFVLVDGEGTTASGSGVNLGGGNRFTSSRIIKGDLLNTLDLDIQEFRFFRGLNTFFNFIGINGSFLGSNTGFTHISGGLGIKIGTQRINNLTATNGGKVKLKDASTGEVEYLGGEVKKIGNQSTASTTYQNIAGFSTNLLANKTYQVKGTIIYQSTGTGNGIGISFAALASGTCDFNSETFENLGSGAGQIRYSRVAGAAANSTGVDTANQDRLINFSAFVRVGGTASVFQPTFRSEGQAGNSVTIVDSSYYSIEELL